MPSSVTTQSTSAGGVSSNSSAVSAGASPASIGASLITSQATTTGTLSCRRRLGQGARARLVAERAVVEDRVGAEQQQRGPLEPSGRLVVLDQLDLEAVRAQLLGELAALVLRRGDRADDTGRRRVKQGFAHRCRSRVCEHDGVLETLPQLDRDRRACSLPPVHERLRLFAHQLLQVGDLQLHVRGRRGQQPPDRSGNRADTRPAVRELASGDDETGEQLLARGRRLHRRLGQGLDRPARHPARAVLAVGSQLRDPLPEDRRHAAIVRAALVRLLVLGARQTGLLAAARARGCHVIAVDRDPGAPGFRLAHRRAILEPDDELALERLADSGPNRRRRRHGRDDRGRGARRGAASGSRIRSRPRPACSSARACASALRLAEAGVPQTRWAVLRGDAEPGFPAVIGPLDRKGRRLAEEAAGGAEVTVTAWSSDGVFTPLLGGGRAARLAARAAEALGIEHGLTSTRLRLGLDGPRVVELRTDVSDREAELCRLLLGIDVHALALDAALGQPAAAEYVRFGTADAQVA